MSVRRLLRSIADYLKIMGERTVVTSTMTTNVGVYAKPDGWRNTVSINFGYANNGNKRRTLKLRSYETLRRYYPDDTALDAPVVYADYDQEHWILGPTPDQNYPYEAIIYRLPDLLSASHQQNYLTKFVPNLLLYSCLVALEPFLKNDSRIATWKDLLADEKGAVTSQDMMKMIDRALRRTGS